MCACVCVCGLCVVCVFCDKMILFSPTHASTLVTIHSVHDRMSCCVVPGKQLIPRCLRRK